MTLGLRILLAIGLLACTLTPISEILLLILVLFRPSWLKEIIEDIYADY